MRRGPEPLRRCVACRRSRPKAELLRVARLGVCDPVVDPEGTAPGRGAYVCREGHCAERALKPDGLARALGRGLSDVEAARLRTALGRAEHERELEMA